jgi:hypothetical protein
MAMEPRGQLGRLQRIGHVQSDEERRVHPVCSVGCR